MGKLGRNKKTLSEMIDEKIEQARAVFDVELDSDETDLLEQMTLGRNWDDPFAITKAMDTQPLYFARWATLLKRLKKEKQIIENKFNVWKSIVKEDLADEIFDENKTAGMTANNAKSSLSSVENRFNKYYVSGEDVEMNKEYLKYHDPLDQINEKIDITDITVKAFEQRKDMLISLGSLIRSMVDNNMLIYRDRNRRQKNKNNK